MLRGHQTRPAAVPASWRGPLPDVSVQRHLNTGGGYAQVPLELVFSDIPDLGILTWALIKLSFEDRAEVATYRQFADELGLGHLQDTAVKRRFLAAVPSLIDAGWLKRSRAADNQVRYQAVVPEGSGRRYAKIRRRDIALLTSPPRGRKQRQVTVAHLADFARWQLECGSRGWTAETTDGLAQHWGVSPRTLRQRRDNIRSTKDVPGLITVEERPGHADLIWLAEVADPHWTTPSAPDTEQRIEAQSERERVAESVPSGVAENVPSPWQFSSPQGGRKRTLPYKEVLTSSLTKDLSELGDASASPLTLLPRELGDASPQAAPKQKNSSPVPGLHASRPPVSASLRQEQGEATHRTAGRLLAQHRHLSSAPAHYVKAMVKFLTRELERGLHPGHIARALERCVVDGEVDAHCELVRLAVRQAWGDQRAGACGECGADVGEHRMGCADRAAEVDAAVDEEAAAEIHAAALASLNSARAGGGPPPQDGRHIGAAQPQPAVDPLASYLPEPREPDWSATDEVEVVPWLTAKMAAAVADAADRPAALQTVWRSWRSQVAPQHAELVDAAAAHLRLVLQQRRAS